jgi:hypothetical protein
MRFLLVAAFLDPLTHEQDVHHDSEDEYENGPDGQNVVPSVHSEDSANSQAYNLGSPLARRDDLGDVIRGGDGELQWVRAEVDFW